MGGNVCKNPMLYQVEGVNGNDLIVKPNPGHMEILNKIVWS